MYEWIFIYRYMTVMGLETSQRSNAHMAIVGAFSVGQCSACAL